MYSYGSSSFILHKNTHCIQLDNDATKMPLNFKMIENRPVSIVFHLGEKTHMKNISGGNSTAQHILGSVIETLASHTFQHDKKQTHKITNCGFINIFGNYCGIYYVVFMYIINIENCNYTKC